MHRTQGSVLNHERSKALYRKRQEMKELQRQVADVLRAEQEAAREKALKRKEWKREKLARERAQAQRVDPKKVAVMSKKQLRSQGIRRVE